MDEKEDKIVIAGLEDDRRRCERENRIICSDFLDMRIQGIAEKYFKKSYYHYIFDGGYDNSERRIMIFLPDWADLSNYNEESPLEILRIQHKLGGKELSHRDYLGSLLGLGIDRGKIGDIIVYPKGADIIILKEMEEFLLANYFKAGRTELSLSAIPITDINLSEVKSEIISDTLASLRLDAYLASAYRCARSKAVDAIKQGLVYVNNAECLKPDKELSEGDKVVLRGKGKSQLVEVGGNSRKDRIFVKIKVFK